jgi:hypothetical protein
MAEMSAVLDIVIVARSSVSTRDDPALVDVE